MFYYLRYKLYNDKYSDTWTFEENKMAYFFIIIYLLGDDGIA